MVVGSHNSSVMSHKNGSAFWFPLRTNDSRLMTTSGFTLIELLVVVGIMIIISALMLANNNRFGGRILLENLGYDMALTVRKAQIFGISVQSTGGGNFGAAYGMHFSMSTPKAYVLFADSAPRNGAYGAGEDVQSFSISRGYQIEKLCTPAGTDISTCNSVSQLDILFKRPEPDAWISINNDPCLTAAAGNTYAAIFGKCQASARVGLIAPSGDRVNFVVDLNGQVSVNKQ